MAFPDLRNQKERRDPEEMLRHLQTFELDLKFSVGIWYFAPGGGRFHDAYSEPKSVPERLEMASGLAKYGVKGIEAHYPLEANQENLHLYKQLERQEGIRLTGIGPHIFWHRDFEFGSLSNPYPDAHDKAYRILVDNLTLVKAADADVCGIWPGIDGYTYSYGHLYYDMWDRFEEAVAAAMDEVPGVRVAIEPKPYEPAPNNIYRTSADGLIMAHDVESRLKAPVNRRLLADGHALVGMQPEIGHVRMGFEDTPYVFSRITREGRLAHTHWNSQPLGNYDQDLNVGVVAPEQAEAALYVLKMHGYRGYFGIDINPERMPVSRALINNMDALRSLNDRINSLDHEQVISATTHPERARGYLEALLIRARSGNPGALSPLPKLG